MVDRISSVIKVSNEWLHNDSDPVVFESKPLMPCAAYYVVKYWLSS